jgi:hypothetical protein
MQQKEQAQPQQQHMPLLLLHSCAVCLRLIRYVLQLPLAAAFLGVPFCCSLQWSVCRATVRYRFYKMIGCDIIWK